MYLYDLKQNESRTRSKTDRKTSPTFGYDSPERAAHHHLEAMESPMGWGLERAIKAADQDLQDLQKRLARLERFAVSLKLKV